MKNKPANKHITDNKSNDNFSDTNEKCIVNWELHHALNKTPISTFSITEI